MKDEDSGDMLSILTDLELVRFLLADLDDDMLGKVGRLRQLSDLSVALGSEGSMLVGGEVAYAAWIEARTSFIHGNFLATVLLSQALAEQMLAALLAMGLSGESIPNRIVFRETLTLCRKRNLISQKDSDDLQRLMELRNPLSHHRSTDDPKNLSRRAIDTQTAADEHLRRDATFAISMAVRLLALPAFRLDS